MPHRSSPCPVSPVRGAASVAGREGKLFRVNLDMSQGELALLLGASRPKVNKALAALEEAEAVRRNGAELICDLEMLKAYAAAE